MRYSEHRGPGRRKRSTTLVDEVPSSNVSVWDGVSVRRGVAVVLSRLADQVHDGAVESFSVSWDGSGKIKFVINSDNGCIEIPVSEFSGGEYEKNKYEE